MSVPTQAFLADLKAAAITANEAEGALRKRMAEEVARLERERVFAYRRLNLMSEVAAAVRPAEDEVAAIACGTGVLRVELGWETDSEARSATLAQFATVVRALFEGLDVPEQKAPASEGAEALRAFEAWYESAYRRPFWALFDQDSADLPLVER